jgi:hypothetical protein
MLDSSSGSQERALAARSELGERVVLVHGTPVACYNSVATGGVVIEGWSCLPVMHEGSPDLRIIPRRDDHRINL